MAAAFVNQGLRRVRKTCMTDVMQQARQADDLPGDGQGRLVQLCDLLEVRLQEVSARGGELVKSPAGKLHDAERVLETCVRRTGIHHFGESQLANVSQTPENPVVDNLAFVFRKPNKPMDRTTNSITRNIVVGQILRLPKG